MLIFLKKILKNTTKNTKKCINTIKKKLKKIGFFNFSYKKKKVYNLIVYNYIYIKKINISFLGHIDTIKNNFNLWNKTPFDLFVNKKKIFGLGISDMKGSISCFFKIIKIYNNLRYLIIITGDEEKNSFSIKYLRKKFFIKRNIRIKKCIIGEPSSSNCLLNNVRIGRRGSIYFCLKYLGKNMHSAYSFDLKNPINIFFKSYKLLYKIKLKKKSKIIFINVKSEKNNLSNVTKKSIFFYINIRYFFKEKIAKLIKKINNILKPNKLTIKSNCKSYLKKNLKGLMIKKKINNLGGTSEGRFIYKYCKEIIECGLSNKYSHKINERINIISIYKLKIIYSKILNSITNYK